MQETDDLEEQQYKRLYWEENIPVKDVRKSTLRKFVYIGSILCIVFILIGFLVKFPDQVELPFIIKSDQSEEIYRFPNPLYVIEKYVKPGDAVTRGQYLIKITSPEIAVMINNCQEAEQKLLNFEAQKKRSIQKQKELIAIHIQENRNNMLQIQNELTSLQKIWESNNTRLQYEYDNAIKKYEANKTLFENKIGSTFSFLETEKNKVAAADVLTSTKQSYEKEKNRLHKLYNSYQLDNNASATELTKLTIDTKYDSTSLYNQFTLAKNKIKNSFGNFEISDGAIVLRAGENGTVSYIFEGDKEIPSGAIVLKIIYNNAPLYAAIACPPSIIGKIKKYQRVALKIASFPFYEWGTAQGHINNLSLTPDEKGNFSIKITIDNFGKLNHLVQIGMNGNAIVILEEKTFYEYFFRTIKKLYYKTTMAN